MGVDSVAEIPDIVVLAAGGPERGAPGVSLGGAYEQYFAGVGHRDRDEYRGLQRTGKSAGKSRAGKASGCAGATASDCSSNASSNPRVGSKKRKSRKILTGRAGCREKDFWI